VRQTAGQTADRAVRLEFLEVGDAYKFTIEDDGQGLSTDRIKQVAVQKGILTPERGADHGREADIFAAVSGGILDGQYAPRMRDGASA
jgi:chemotaxis protein histidine kinase CheA